jgi:hypothetical protein
MPVKRPSLIGFLPKSNQMDTNGLPQTPNVSPKRGLIEVPSN